MTPLRHSTIKQAGKSAASQSAKTPARTPAFFGPYQLVRQLGSAGVVERHGAIHVRRQTSHLIYRFGEMHDRVERRRLNQAFELLAGFKHPHAMPIEHFAFGAQGRGWLVSTYPGNQDGLVTLSNLLELKGGRLGEFEAERAIGQLLSLVQAGHDRGLHHEPLTIGEVLVDRSGALVVELFGFRHVLASRGVPAAGFDPMLAREELRGVAELGYLLLTGLELSDSAIPPSRLLRKLDRAWDEWFEAATDPSGGYQSAAEAAEALPSSRRLAEPPTPPANKVRVVLDRFRVRTP